MQKIVTLESADEVPYSVPAGMALIALDELTALRRQASLAATLGPLICIDYRRLTRHVSEAKDLNKYLHPEAFAYDPADTNELLDRLLGKKHLDYVSDSDSCLRVYTIRTEA